MKEDIIKRVCAQTSRCLENLLDGEHYYRGYAPMEDTFRVTRTQELGGGLTRYDFETLAEPLARSDPEEKDAEGFAPGIPFAPAPEEIAGSIVLDADYGFTRDEKGHIRLGPWKCLDPETRGA